MMTICFYRYRKWQLQTVTTTKGCWDLSWTSTENLPTETLGMYILLYTWLLCIIISRDNLNENSTSSLFRDFLVFRDIPTYNINIYILWPSLGNSNISGIKIKFDFRIFRFIYYVLSSTSYTILKKTHRSSQNL